MSKLLLAGLLAFGIATGNAAAGEIPQCVGGTTVDELIKEHEAFEGATTKFFGEEAQAIKERVFAKVPPPLWVVEADVQYVLVTIIPQLNSVVITFINGNGCFVAEIWFPVDEGAGLVWERGF